MEDGVWRTVGGRRIFIKNGQDLSSAMKASGKFNKKKKKIDLNDHKEIDRIADSYENIDNYELDDITRDYIKNRRKEMAQAEFTNKANEIHEKSLARAIENEKSMDEDKRYNTNSEAKKDNRTLKEIDADYYGVPASARTEEMTKEWNKARDQKLKETIGNDVKKLQKYADKEGVLPSELQDRLGIKDSDLGFKDEYTEKFENEMQGMQRYLKAEEAKKSTNNSDSEWNKVKENINNIKDERLRSRMQKEIEEVEKSGKGEWKSASYLQDKYRKHQGEINREDYEMMSKPHYEYEVVKDQKYYDWVDKTDPNTNMSDKELEEVYRSTYPNRVKKVQKGTNGDWLKKAFQDYKKEHKNTKLTFDDFKKKQK